MKRILTILAFVTLLAVNIKAQKENHNWFFGSKIGLTWNITQNYPATGMWGTPNATLSDIPTSIPSSMSTGEGCFSISDVNGELLFYSDGITIWNKNGNPMPNANGHLTGHPSSAQSGIIVPYPGKPNQYIAFTLGFGNHNNLSYSVVDMTLDGGLGDVVVGQRNIRLTGYSGVLGESLTAIRHRNREDFWLVAAGRGNPAYLNVWKVNSAGVSATPHQRISTGANIPATTAPCGYIASSPAGDKYVWCTYNPGTPQVHFMFGAFDNEAGIIKNIKRRDLGTTTTFGATYGAAFSKSGEYIYITSLTGTRNISGHSSLAVFKFNDLLAAANPNTVAVIRQIAAGKGLPSNGINEHFGALGLAPNGYLYIVHPFSKNMYTITNPEDPANMKIYKLSNLALNGIENIYGIPTAAAPWFRFQIVPPPETIACNTVATSYEFRVYGGEGFNDLKSIVIDFGDNKSDSKVTILNPSVGSHMENHVYDKIGEYTITIKAYDQYDNEMQGMEKSSTIKVKSCALPVNPNIH